MISIPTLVVVLAMCYEPDPNNQGQPWFLDDKLLGASHISGFVPTIDRLMDDRHIPHNH